MRGWPTMTSHAVPVTMGIDWCLRYRGIGVAMVNGSECHGKQRQGGKLLVRAPGNKRGTPVPGRRRVGDSTVLPNSCANALNSHRHSTHTPPTAFAEKSSKLKPQVPPKPSTLTGLETKGARIIPPPPNRPLPPDPLRNMDDQQCRPVRGPTDGLSSVMQLVNKFGGPSPQLSRKTTKPDCIEEQDSCRVDMYTDNPNVTSLSRTLRESGSESQSPNEAVSICHCPGQRTASSGNETCDSCGLVRQGRDCEDGDRSNFGPSKIPNRDSGIESVSSAFAPDDLETEGPSADVSAVATDGGTDGSTTEDAVTEESASEGTMPDGIETPPQENLYKIADELLQTEKAYVSRLHLLDKVFCAQLLEEARNKSTFPTEVVNGIFSNISSICLFHQDFLLPELEKRMQEWNVNPRIGDVLQKLAPFLKMYGEYVKNFDPAMDLLSTWMEKSVQFKAIIQEIQKMEVCRNLTLQHHMLEPVQRIPRYELLLKDYLKRLPLDSPDRNDAQKSLEIISTAANHSNAAIRKMEKMHTLLKVFEMLDGEEDIVHPSNELIKEGQILKLSAKNGSVQERHVFLFNNMLLYCAPKLRLMGLQKFSVRTRIGIDGMQLHEADTAGQPNTFTVAGKQRSLIIRSRSEAEKEQWIKAIRETLEMHEKNSETFKAFNSSFNREEGCDLPMSELGQRQPKFVRDKSIVECMRCEEAFSALTRRKHHCRACGHVVCGRCSDYKVQLTYDNRLGRVCRNCYTVLHPEPLDGEEEVSIEHGDEIQSNNLICGYLNLVERGTRLSRIWCTIFTKEPLVLYVFETPKDTKPLRTIPLPGYTVVRAEAGEVGDLKHALRLTQSRQTLYIGVENEEAQEQWSKFLSEAAKGNVPEMHGFTACHASDLETEESIVT